MASTLRSALAQVALTSVACYIFHVVTGSILRYTLALVQDAYGNYVVQARPGPSPGSPLRSLHLTLGPPLRCACAELTIALSAYWALGTGVTAERSPLRAEPLGS